MSQENDIKQETMNEENDADNSQSAVTKSEVNATEQESENKDLSSVSDSSDSGLPINSQSQSLSGVDDSTSPITDENLSSPQSGTDCSEGAPPKATPGEGDNMVSDAATAGSADAQLTEGVSDKQAASSETDKDADQPVNESTKEDKQVDAGTKHTDENAPHEKKSPETTDSIVGNDTPELSAPKVSNVVKTSDSDGTVAKDTTSEAVKTNSEEDGAVKGATSLEGATASPANDEKSPLQNVYHIKCIRFKDNLYPIVTQNENGPCPLLAIINLLILQGKIKMPAMVEMVTSGQLMEYLADCIFEHAPKDITEDAQLNYEQNMHDAMAVFHKLQTGLDVNVKFTSVSTFEYTSECIVFDLLAIPLYHGWLVDPDSPGEVAALGNLGYNQLVEKIITQKNSAREELVTEALIAEEFLNRTSHQLTYHGLSELSSTLKDQQMCVFFRNNHFSTLYKHKNELFLLVTDQGFLTESNVVWETLSNVEGDGHFVDADFHTYRKPEVSTHPIPQPSVALGSDQQVDTDYLVALSLQQEAQQQQQMAAAAASQKQQAGAQPAAGTAVAVPGAAGQPHQLSDHELAMRLQEEENRQAKLRQQQLANQQHLSQQHQQRMALEQQNREKKKDKSSDCVIL